ncbi:unnamed protein product [Vicia faba]|uniref:Uncharacterized protein n=1 Tax=Vicia faba TaxID=3906 RepID=A0AAV0ZDY5_VICFA|nr:unnamed protein product [Vicia faba]
MKCLYWNIRGVAKASYRLALKRFLKLHNPDFLFIAEPKIDFVKFPKNWIVGCPMFVLSKKLQLLKRDLKGWNRNIFGNIANNVSKEEENLGIIQQDIQNNDTNDILKRQENAAQSILSYAFAIEDSFWWSKS